MPRPPESTATPPSHCCPTAPIRPPWTPAATRRWRSPRKMNWGMSWPRLQPLAKKIDRRRLPDYPITRFPDSPIVDFPIPRSADRRLPDYPITRFPDYPMLERGQIRLQIPRNDRELPSDDEHADRDEQRAG